MPKSAEVVPPGEQRRKLAKRSDRFVAELHTAQLDEKIAARVMPLVADSAHAELPGELLDDPLEVGELVHRIALRPLVKRREPPTGQRDRQPPAFRRLAVVVAEHPSDLEQRRVGGHDPITLGTSAAERLLVEPEDGQTTDPR